MRVAETRRTMGGCAGCGYLLKQQEEPTEGSHDESLVFLRGDRVAESTAPFGLPHVRKVRRLILAISRRTVSLLD